MSRREQEEERVRAETIRAYLASAEDDLRLAELALAAPDYRGWGQIGFHAQQAAEKLLKAMLINHHIHPDPHHDIGELRGQLRLWDRPLADELREADSLTPFAVRFRYPPKDISRPHPMGRARASKAVEIARQVRERIESRLRERGYAVALGAPRGPLHPRRAAPRARSTRHGWGEGVVPQHASRIER